MRRFMRDPVVWFGVVTTILFAVLITYNVVNNSSFWDMSIYNVVSVATAIIITYYLTQRKNDMRKHKEAFDSKLESLQRIIVASSSETIINGTGEDIKLLLRRVRNKISILDEYAKSFNVELEMQYIRDRFKELDEFVGDHIADLDYLKKSKVTIDKYIDNISSKIDALQVNLYKPN